MVEGWCQNSKFFHLSTIIKRHRNNINLIKDEGNWIQGDKEIAAYFKKQFDNIFSSSFPRHSLELENLFAGERILEEENMLLSRLPTEAEIKDCV